MQRNGLKAGLKTHKTTIDIGAVHSDINMVIANNELMLTAWWFSFPVTL